MCVWKVLDFSERRGRGIRGGEVWRKTRMVGSKWGVGEKDEGQEPYFIINTYQIVKNRS